MAFDGFMYFGKAEMGAVKIEGETKDKTYIKQKAFEIKSFSLDVENPNSISSSGGGAGTGKAKLNPFKVTKVTDNCSPSLFVTCCRGGHYESANISIRKAGASSDKSKAAGLEYIRFQFNMVFVTNIEWSGDSGDELPSETVTFAYGSMTIMYWPQEKTGGEGEVNKTTWNQITNDEDVAIK